MSYFKFLFSSLLMLLSFSGQAQFVNLLGTTGYDAGKEVIVGFDGNYLLAGTTGSSSTNKNIIISKISPDGYVFWTKSYGGTGDEDVSSLIRTKDSAYVFIGYTTSSGNGNWDALIVKIDTSGNVIWSRTNGGSSQDEYRTIYHTSDSCFLMGGATQSYGAGQLDAWVVKLDKEGNLCWSITKGATFPDYGMYANETDGGNYLISFYGRGFTGNYGLYDWALMKLDTSGNTITMKKYGSSGNEGIRHFLKTWDNNFLIVGESSHASLGKAMVIKVDSSGNQIDRKLFGTSTGHVDIFKSCNTLDSGCLIVGYSGTEGVLIKLNKNLDLQWSRVFAQSNSQFTWGVAYDEREKNIVWTGHTNQSGSFGGVDIFFVKSDSLGSYNCNNTDGGISLFTPGTGVYNWGTLSSISTSSGSNPGNYSIPSSTLNLSSLNLNKNQDSLPLNFGTPLICHGDSTLLDATSKATEWKWSTGSDSAKIYVRESGVYRVRVERPYCYNEDSVEVTKLNPVRVTAFQDTSLCLGQILNYSASGTGGDTSKYSFIWYDSVTNVIQAVGEELVDTLFQNVTYKVVLWDSCSIRDSMYATVRIKNELNVSTTADTLACAGESVIIGASGSGGNTGNYLFEWSNSLGNGNFKTVDSNTTATYQVILSDNCSNSDTGFVLVQRRPALSVSVNPDTVICIGESYSLQASATGGDSSYIFSWDNNLGTGNNKTVSPVVTTVYKVILTDECTVLPDSAFITVTVRPSLTVSARSDTTVCLGEYFPLFASGTGGDSTTYVFSWNNGLDTGRSQNVSLDASANLMVILSDGCSDRNDTDFVAITVRNPLDITMPNDTTICQGRSVTLVPSGSGGDVNNYNFSWDNGLGTGSSKTVSPGITTTYTVILSDGCTETNDTSQLTVFVRPELEITPRSDTLVCIGQSVDIYANGSGGDSLNFTYTWDNGLGAGQSKSVSPATTTQYRVILTDNCTVAPDTGFITVSVRDPLSVVSRSDTTICIGETLDLYALGMGGYSPQYKFNWDHNVDSGRRVTIGPESTLTYRVILEDFCTVDSDTDYVTISVRTPLDIAPRSDTTICIGQNMLLFGNSTGGYAPQHTLYWNNGLGSGNYIAISPDSSVQYQVILRDNCTVEADTGYVNITVRPPLDIVGRADTTICIGQNVLLNATSVGGFVPAHVYSWDQSVGTGNNLSVSPAVTTDYQVILTDNCTTVPDTDYVQIKVRPALDLQERADTLICVGEMVDLYATATGGDSLNYLFTWDNGLGFGAIKSVSPDTTTVYRVILTDNCTHKADTAFVTVLVRPPLELTERYDTIICVGQTVKLFAQSAGGYDPQHLLSWDNGLGNGNDKYVTPLVTTDYRVILTDNCTERPDTGYVNVKVRLPLSLIKRSDSTICIGEEIELYFDGTGGDSLHYTFIWDNDGGIGNYRKVTPQTTTHYTVHLTDNCTLEKGSDSVLIQVRPPLEISERSDTLICTGEEVMLRALTNGGDTDRHFITWDQGVGQKDSAGVTPRLTTTYMGVLQDNCTVKPDTGYVTVNVRQPLKVTPRGDTLICVGEYVNLFASGEGGDSTRYTFTWDHALDTGQMNFVAPPNTEVYKVILSDNCTDTADTAFVTVNVRDPLSIIARTDSTICIGESIQLSGLAGGGDSSRYFLTWDNNLGVADSPFVSPAVTTTYEVVLRDLCTVDPDTAQMTVYVRQPIKVYPRTDTTICIGESLFLDAEGTGGDSLNYIFTWDNGIGQGKAPQISPDTTMVYQVVLTDNCTTIPDTTSLTVSVRPPLQLAPRSDSTICIGQSVELWGQTQGGDTDRHYLTWDNGVGISDNPVVSPSVTTTYEAVLHDMCTTDPDTATLTIYVRPPLNIVPRSDTTICIGEVVLLDAEGSGGDSMQYIYAWDNGIGSVKKYSVSPSLTTVYKIRLDDNCTSVSDSALVTVYVRPPLEITPRSDTTICIGQSVQLHATATGGDSIQYRYSWDNGLGVGQKHLVSPSTTTVYTAEIEDFCTSLPDTATVRIYVRPPLQVTARTDTFICQGEQVILYAAGSGGDSTNYTFNWDNGIGNAVNPVVSPGVNTTYKVVLTDNCTLLSHEDTAFVELPVPLQISTNNDTLVCRDNPVNLSATATGGIPAQYVFTWTGLGTGPMHTVSSGITKTYEVYLDDNCAHPVVDSVIVNVQPQFFPGFITDPEWDCRPSFINFQDTTSGVPTATWYLWDFGDGTRDSATDLNQITHSYQSTGNYQIRLIIKTPLGCLDTSYYRSYTIHEDPVAKFTSQIDPNGTSDMSIIFTNQSSGAIDYHWDYGDTSGLDYRFEGIYNYKQGGLYTVKLVVENEFGCLDTAVATLDIKDPYRIYIPNAITLDNNNLNEVFAPQGTGFTDYDLTIYNRWGQELFSEKKSKGWNGINMYSQTVVPDGTYFYTIKVYAHKGTHDFISGTVIILR